MICCVAKTARKRRKSNVWLTNGPTDRPTRQVTETNEITVAVSGCRMCNFVIPWISSPSLHRLWITQISIDSSSKFPPKNSPYLVKIAASFVVNLLSMKTSTIYFIYSYANEISRTKWEGLKVVFCTHIYDNFVGFLVSVNRSGKKDLVRFCWRCVCLLGSFFLSHTACLSLIFHVISLVFPTHIFKFVPIHQNHFWSYICFLLTFLLFCYLSSFFIPSCRCIFPMSRLG